MTLLLVTMYLKIAGFLAHPFIRALLGWDHLVSIRVKIGPICVQLSFPDGVENEERDGESGEGKLRREKRGGQGKGSMPDAYYGFAPIEYEGRLVLSREFGDQYMSLLVCGVLICSWQIGSLAQLFMLQAHRHC